MTQNPPRVRLGFHPSSRRGKKWYWMSGCGICAVVRVKAPTSTWVEAQTPPRVRNHRAPTAILARGPAWRLRVWRFSRSPLHVHFQVVLEIPADAGQVVQHGDRPVTQVVRGPDAGEHEQLRGLEGAGGENHLSFRANGFGGAVSGELDATRPAAVPGGSW